MVFKTATRSQQRQPHEFHRFLHSLSVCKKHSSFTTGGLANRIKVHTHRFYWSSFRMHLIWRHSWGWGRTEHTCIIAYTRKQVPVCLPKPRISFSEAEAILRPAESVASQAQPRISLWSLQSTTICPDEMGLNIGKSRNHFSDGSLPKCRPLQQLRDVMKIRFMTWNFQLAELCRSQLGVEKREHRW